MENKKRRCRLAIVTGGSSGIGFCLARRLSGLGFRVILVGRNEERLRQAAAGICGSGGRAEAFPCDLSREEECRRLHRVYCRRPVSVLVNAAGVGVYGDFDATAPERELEMLDVNGRAVHLLMKLFLADMERRGGGRILNVASSAGLTPGGPYMAAYYATKAYVVSLTCGVAEELRAAGSPVYAGVLCPGPVDTPFFARAGIRAAVRGADPEAVAEAAIRGMRKKQTVIVPGRSNRLACLAAKLLPARATLAVNRRIQAKKRKTE